MEVHRGELTARLRHVAGARPGCCRPVRGQPRPGHRRRQPERRHQCGRQPPDPRRRRVDVDGRAVGRRSREAPTPCSTPRTTCGPAVRRRRPSTRSTTIYPIQGGDIVADQVPVLANVIQEPSAPTIVDHGFDDLNVPSIATASEPSTGLDVPTFDDAPSWTVRPTTLRRPAPRQLRCHRRPPRSPAGPGLRHLHVSPTAIRLHPRQRGQQWPRCRRIHAGQADSRGVPPIIP